MGARIAPVIKGKWPGNIDWMQKMVHNRVHGYPGMDQTAFYVVH
jgi:hypothetical protein